MPEDLEHFSHILCEDGIVDLDEIAGTIFPLSIEHLNSIECSEKVLKENNESLMHALLSKLIYGKRTSPKKKAAWSRKRSQGKQFRSGN